MEGFVQYRSTHSLPASSERSSRGQYAVSFPSIVVVTDAGGMGVLIADAVDLFHMELGTFAPSTVSQFRSLFPPYYQCANPMDLTGSAKTEDMLKAGHLALDDPNVDAVIMGLQPIAPGFDDPLTMAKLLTSHFGPGKTKKPFLIVEFGGTQSADRMLRTTLKENGMAVYGSAEEALRGLDKLMNYVEFLEIQNKEKKDVMSPNK